MHACEFIYGAQGKLCCLIYYCCAVCRGHMPRIKTNYIKKNLVRHNEPNRLRKCNFNIILFFLFSLCTITGLRHLCQELDNCEDGMVCESEISTKPAAFGAKTSTNQYKVCLCDKEGGWEEDVRGHHCSTATNLMSGVASTVGSLLIGYLLARKQIH